MNRNECGLISDACVSMRVCFDSLCFSSTQQRLADEEDASQLQTNATLALTSGSNVGTTTATIAEAIGVQIGTNQVPTRAPAMDTLRDLQELLRVKDERIAELESLLCRRDSEIQDLRSHLDKFLSVLPFKSPLTPTKPRPRKQRAQGISAEPPLQQLAPLVFYDKSDNEVIWISWMAYVSPVPTETFVRRIISVLRFLGSIRIFLVRFGMFFPWTCAQAILLVIFHAANAIFCGEDASQDQFKYIVEIVFDGCGNAGICGGAILDETHILTTAHCVSGFKKEELFIIAGVTDLLSPLKIERQVAKIHIHEEYQYWGDVLEIESLYLDSPEELPAILFENDIAVLTLAEALLLGDRISRVQLPESHFLPSNIQTPYASWGNIKMNTSITTLRWTNLTILDPDDCYELTEINDPNQFCAMDPEKKSCILEGDSGAPLVFNNFIIGVTSYSTFTPEEPSIFTKVFGYLDFIEQALED